jgi:Uma2 family endonuclease
MTTEVNIGESENDYRVPDAALHRPGAGGTWHETAALVVEIVSPRDETWEKLPFYARHGVDAVVIVDPQRRTVEWLELEGGAYLPVERSSVVDLGKAELADAIEWPVIDGADPE